MTANIRAPPKIGQGRIGVCFRRLPSESTVLSFVGACAMAEFTLVLVSPDTTGIWRDTAGLYAVQLEQLAPGGSMSSAFSTCHALCYEGALETAAIGLQASCPLIWIKSESTPLESAWGSQAFNQTLSPTLILSLIALNFDRRLKKEWL